MTWLDTKDEPDTMKLLATADVLVTDWASVQIDFMVTGRPMICLKQDGDIKYYTNERGQPVLPLEFRSGMIVNDDELYAALVLMVQDKKSLYNRREIHPLTWKAYRHPGNTLECIIEKVIKDVIHR